MSGSHGEKNIDRRAVLATIAGVVSGSVAGCAGGDTSESTGTPGFSADRPRSSPDQTTSPRPPMTDTPSGAGGSGPSTPDEPSPTGTGTTTVTLELDLAEANVMAVSFDRTGTEVTFDVTLYHDDDGESGYANWWQVETLDGEQLGRRELLHAHGTQEFTRSDRFSIPEGTTWVVVRGHDQSHGYGGRAMLVNLTTGEMRAALQGAEPESFADFEG